MTCAVHDMLKLKAVSAVPRGTLPGMLNAYARIPLRGGVLGVPTDGRMVPWMSPGVLFVVTSVKPQLPAVALNRCPRWQHKQ